MSVPGVEREARDVTIQSQGSHLRGCREDTVATRQRSVHFFLPGPTENRKPTCEERKLVCAVTKLAVFKLRMNN